MLNTAQTRFASAPRAIPAPDLRGELRADKGPKYAGFDAPFLGCGRSALERAQKMDRKR
jgi:hypothetical protein